MNWEKAILGFENNVDSDQLASENPVDQDLQGFLSMVISAM